MNLVMSISKVGVVILISASLILSGCGKSKARKQVKKERARIMEEMKQEEAKYLADQKRREEERKRKKASRIATTEKGRQERKRKQQEKQRIAEEKERQAKALKQKELTVYANKRFSEISMDPKVMLSPRAKEMNFSFRFIGKDLQAYKKHLVEKNWLGIMMLLYPDQNGEYEDKDSIDTAVRHLKGKEFQFFVKINPASVPKGEFCYLSIPSVDDPDADWNGKYGVRYDNLEAVWEKHPDGNGVMHEWVPFDKEILILVSDKVWSENGSVHHVRIAIDAQFVTAVQKLERKKELGEVDETGIAVQMRQLKIKRRNAYLSLLKRF